jgi:hypothetical protein
MSGGVNPRRERRLARRAQRQQGGVPQGLANRPIKIQKVIEPKPLKGGRRLKVRNLDEKAVTNDDLKVLTSLN